MRRKNFSFVQLGDLNAKKYVAYCIICMCYKGISFAICGDRIRTVNRGNQHSRTGGVCRRASDVGYSASDGESVQTE